MKSFAYLRKAAGGLALSLGTIIVCVLLIEIGFRVFAPGENVPQREYDPHLGWRGRPDLDCVLKERHFSMALSQNADGFRDQRRSVDKPEGILRVLCTGDSFTWGWGVEQESVYTHVLEERLRHQGYPIEVINTGVGGYSTDQSLVYLKRKGLSYSPDIVIHQVARNDIPGNTHSVTEGLYQKPFFVLGSGGDLTLKNYPVSAMSTGGRLKYWISRHSRLAYFAKHRLHLRRHAPARVGSPPQASSKPETDVGYPFRLFCELISTMRDECEAEGARLAVLIDFQWTPEEMSYWSAACEGVETHFLYEYLMEKQETYNQEAFIPLDGHWTEAGHRWIADYLYDHVLSDFIRKGNLADEEISMDWVGGSPGPLRPGPRAFAG